MPTFTACPVQPLVGFNPAKEFAICFTGKHVKAIGTVKMNIPHLEASASTDSYDNVVFILPKDAVWR